jgi:hypothetical protein
VTNVAGHDWTVDDLGVVGAAAAVVVAASLPWYEVRTGAAIVQYRGWGLGGVALFAILAAVYAAGRVLFMKGRPPRPDVPITPQAETFAAAAVGLALMTYRLLDVPGAGGARTNWLVVAAFAALAQVAFAGHALRRSGLRATPPEE